MVTHDTDNLNNKLVLAKRVSLWDIEDIDLLFSSAGEIQQKFGLKDLIGAETYTLFRSELLEMIEELKCADNERLGELTLSELGDSIAILNEFLLFKEEGQDISNPFAFVFLITSWAYISKCEKIKALAYRVFSDLGFPVNDIHTKSFSSQR